MAKILPYRKRQLQEQELTIVIKPEMARRLRQIAVQCGVEPEALVLMGAAGEVNRGWNWATDKPKEKVGTLS